MVTTQHRQLHLFRVILSSNTLIYIPALLWSPFPVQIPREQGLDRVNTVVMKLGWNPSHPNPITTFSIPSRPTTPVVLLDKLINLDIIETICSHIKNNFYISFCQENFFSFPFLQLSIKSISEIPPSGLDDSVQ